jgi:hypothetical protein
LVFSSAAFACRSLSIFRIISATLPRHQPFIIGLQPQSQAVLDVSDISEMADQREKFEQLAIF